MSVSNLDLIPIQHYHGVSNGDYIMEDSIKTLRSSANEIFIDLKVNGFTVNKSLAYNLLCSAIYYIQTGNTMVGSRARTLMQ